MGGANQAVTIMSSPEAAAPSAIVQIAKSPNPFAAMHNAEPPSFPGPMFLGLNAIVNPFSTSGPSSAAAHTRSLPATRDAAGTHAVITAAAAPASATATVGAKPLPAATTAVPSSSVPATAMLAMPAAVAAQPPPSTSATAVVAGVQDVACRPHAQVANTMESPSTDILSLRSTAAPVQPTPAVPAGNLSLFLHPAAEAAEAAGAAAAAAPAAGVAMSGTAPLPANTSAALGQTRAADPAAVPVQTRAAGSAAVPVQTQAADSAAVPVQSQAADSAAVPVQSQAADSAAVPVQTPAADSAAVPVRNASKRKWDAMTRPEPASITALATAAPVAPVPSSSTAATINSTAAETDAGTASFATPAALPTATAQAGPAGAVRAPAAAQNNALSQNPSSLSVSASEASRPQPASQALEAASKQSEAASKALAGKEIAAKLAAGFAEQHRSGISTTARALPTTTTISSGVPGPITLSEAAQIAAAAAAEKLIRDQASKARLSVQSSGDTHAARMEAIRLRNVARHDVPEPVALPPPPPQPDTTAVALDRPQPAAQASAATDQPQNSPRNSSKGKSKARRKRHRELSQVPWETEEMPGLTGKPGESGMSGAGGRRRTDSPASGNTWDTVRQQAHSPGTRQVSLVIISNIAMLGVSVAMLGVHQKISQNSQWGFASLSCLA